MRRLHFSALIALLIPGFMAQTCSAQSGRSQDELSVRRFLQSSDDTLKDRFVIGFVDLNGDGISEAIVHLTSNYWCGSGGCSTLVLMRNADSWKILTKISITRPPIRVLTTKSNGWRSISVWVQGGGIQAGYEAELHFDGKTYPANPTVPPARPIAGKAEGEVVIPSSVGR